jgi:hypothetical protein
LSIDRPLLPFVPRLINGAGRLLAGAGVTPVRLDAEALLAAACRSTRLDDFGGEEFRDGLDRLLASLEAEARLTLLGRLVVREDLGLALRNRLRVQDWHARHPEIAQEPVRRPIVIAGQGRTGTTILHELMALDPANRVPLTWEVDDPVPPPERATYRTDPRIAASQAKLDRSESLIPDFKRMHRMGATLPQECVRITAMAFTSIVFAATWRVPGYTRWLLDDADLAPAYRLHRRTLQLLQWRCPAERWVVKSPAHLWHLDALREEYPDVCLVQTHRDPLKILSSLTSLEVVLRSMASDAIDAPEIAREWSRWLTEGYDRAVDFRERKVLPPSQVIDVQFRDFVRDPVSEVRRIYDHFGLELRLDVAAAMKDYVASNPSDRDGAHRHDFSATGLDPDEERARVTRYQRCFGVESEAVVA